MKNTPIGNQITGAINAVKSSNKSEAIKYLIPQRLEDGKLYNFNNVCIGTVEGAEDVVFTKEFTPTSRVTAVFIKRYTDPVEKFFAEPTESQEEAEASEEAIGDGSEGAEKKSKKKDKKSKVKDETDDTLNVGTIKDLIEKGDKKSLKKAKKALEAQFDEDHPNYAELAKGIKKAKKALK